MSVACSASVHKCKQLLGKPGENVESHSGSCAFPRECAVSGPGKASLRLSRCQQKCVTLVETGSQRY